MPVIRDTFGHLQDGRRVARFVLSHPDSGFFIEVLEFGARLRTVSIPVRQSAPLNTILAYDTLREYELDSAQLGGTIGRCANRTVASALSHLSLSCNDGANHLHGGHVGFSRSLWRAVSWTGGHAPSVRLEHLSADGEEGYRGNVSATMEFTIDSPWSFRAVVEATTDQATPLNLTLHPYFNLTGDPRTTIEDHELTLPSDTFLPLGPDQVPTGEICRVDGTVFDFRQSTLIGSRLKNCDPQLQLAGGYDHYWPIVDNAVVAAELFSPLSGIRLCIQTNQPGLQFYAGNSLATATPPRFRTRAGLCLEPHGFPNAMNEPRFPSITLQPGETYRHSTTYAFSFGP